MHHPAKRVCKAEGANTPIATIHDALSDDQILKIFSSISPLHTSPYVLLGVCRAWRLHYSTGVLWRKIYAQHFYEAGTPLPSADGARRECNFKMQAPWQDWITAEALQKFRASEYTSLSLSGKGASLPDKRKP